MENPQRMQCRTSAVVQHRMLYKHCAQALTVQVNAEVLTEKIQ